jgi:hypothetical protein
MRFFILCTIVLSLVGCGSEARLKPAPVGVLGKVSQAGQPVGSIVMVFQPLGEGHMREFAIHKDGTFNGELISGEYAYYVGKLTNPAAAVIAKKLPAKYFEADLSRTVTIEPGKQLAIELN